MGGTRICSRSEKSRCVIVSVVIVIGLLLAACSGTGEEHEAEAVTCESQPFVDHVEIVERTGDHYAIVTGNYPDACTKTTSALQETDGATITITLCTTQPEGLACAQMLTPFEEEYPLDTQDLDSGTYTVDVHGAWTTFTID